MKKYTEDTLSPKTGESQLGKTMAAMVIVGCMASVIYIVRKRELYENRKWIWVYVLYFLLFSSTSVLAA